MDRRQLLTAAALQLVLQPAATALSSRAFADSKREESMSRPTQRMIETNGIHLNVAEQGDGPVVLLCHGFPESWYSWRHQIGALAAAGFHPAPPAMPAYAQTAPPQPTDHSPPF